LAAAIVVGKGTIMKSYLSKKFFLTALVICGLVNIIGSVVLLAAPPKEILIPVLALMAVAVVLATVLGCIIFHRTWAAIQDGHARTTPGKAVGFLFIPLFNLYWIFQALPGFAKDYNRFIARHDLGAPALSEPFFLTATILTLSNIIIGRIPGVGIVYSAGVMIVMIALLNQLLTAVNRLAAVGGGVVTPAEDLHHDETLHTMIGVVAILFSVYAIVHQVFWYMGLKTYGQLWTGIVLAILNLLYWALVMYLGWLCRNMTLRIIAMCLPAIPILLKFWPLLQGRY
jgi:hypothetical protein